MAKILVDLSLAKEIFGSFKVISKQEAEEFWKVKSNPSISETLRYNFTTLRTHARECRQNDWRIIYALPISFRQQFQILSKKSDPETLRIYEHYWWSRREIQSFWVDSKPEEGYYLIDIYPRYHSSSWFFQQERVDALGAKFERADERVYSQLVLAVGNIHGLGYLQKVDHWGSISTAGECKVSVLEDRQRCDIKLHGTAPELPEDKLGTCISRKWDF